MRRAFGDAGALVLIGDPKQAIYAFRGADVFAYLEAAQAAGTRATLGVEPAQRPAPDRRLRRAVRRRAARSRRDRLPPGQGDAGAPGAAARGRRRGAADPRGAPRRAGHRHDPARLRAQPVGPRRTSPPTSPPTSCGCCPRTPRIEGRRVEPGDVAVLVGRNRSAAQVRDALEAVDVPAVINGAGSVFGTASAVEWLRLLEALERPASSPRARAAALTPFLGWTAERVATAAEPEWEAVHRRLHDWARVLRLRGVASLGEAIALAEGLPERVLATVEGERQLTDLRHVAQLLHEAATAEGLGTTALTAWLRRRIAEAGQDTSDEDRSRRLESDADAVQVLTIHRSKGLEFPIVYLPFPWEPSFIPKAEPVVFHDPQNGDRRTIDVALEGREFDAHKALRDGRAARRGPAARVRRADPRPPPGRGLVGAVVRQPPLGARAPAVRARGGRLGAAGRARHADRRRGREALRRAGRGGARLHLGRALEARHAGQLERRAGRPGAARGRGLRPHARRRLAPHVVLRHHARRARGARRERARGAVADRRARVRAADRRGARRRARPARRDARGRRRRHVRAPPVRAHRLRGRGPRRRAGRARARPAGALAGRRRRPGRRAARAADRDRDAARRERAAAARRDARRPARRAGVRAAAGRRRRRGRAARPRRGRGRAARPPPRATTRSAATRTGSATRRCGAASAAT